MSKSSFSLEFSDEIERQLDRVSTLTNQSKTMLVRVAVVEYLNQIDWRAREIEAALAEADAGVFISHEAMLKWAENLSGEAGLSASDNASA